MQEVVDSHVAWSSRLRHVVAVAGARDVLDCTADARQQRRVVRHTRSARGMGIRRDQRSRVAEEAMVWYWLRLQECVSTGVEGGKRRAARCAVGAGCCRCSR